MPKIVGSSEKAQALKEEKAKLLILLVGVNQYDDSNKDSKKKLTSLNHCANDCRELAAYFGKVTQLFPLTKIIAIHDQGDVLPLLENVKENLENLINKAKEESQQRSVTIIFYFSGHGLLDERTQEPILCFRNTQSDQLDTTGLKVSELLETLAQSQAQNIVLLLDSCHSGGTNLSSVNLSRGEVEEGEIYTPITPQLQEILRQRTQESRGFYGILSCDRQQKSLELPELKHGIFTYFLIQGLKGKAADEQGIITADTLYLYILEEVPKYIDKVNQNIKIWNKQIEKNRGDQEAQKRVFTLQQPWRIVQGTGELILGISPLQQGEHLLKKALIIHQSSASETVINLTQILGHQGDFEVKILYQETHSSEQIKEAIKTCVESGATVLLYLRGEIKDIDNDEYALFLGDECYLTRSWLQDQLMYSQASQQVIIFDFLTEHNLEKWAKGLELLDRNQCIIAACLNTDSLTGTFVKILGDEKLTTGLNAAQLITQLQDDFKGTNITFYPFISTPIGTIDITLSAQEYITPLTQDLGICPYKGLEAFTKKDAVYFYGRKSLSEEIIKKLETTSFLAVVGASGSGKSSVVQAGVLAKLDKEGLVDQEDKSIKSCLTRGFRPGENPIQSLVKCLASNEKEAQQIEGYLHSGVDSFVLWLRQQEKQIIVLLIDQFEELFTLTSEANKKAFIELILGASKQASDRFKVIITLRSDFLSSVLDIPNLADLIKENNILVPSRLNKGEYRNIIVEPARKVGLSIEQGLIDVLTQEVEDTDGALPLLELALKVLYENGNRGGRLTLQAYQEEIKGLTGILEGITNNLYESLNEQEKECFKWIFLSLVSLGEGKEDTRRRVKKSDLLGFKPELISSILQKMIKSRLIVVTNEEEQFNQIGVKGEDINEELDLLKSEVTVEIAHEIIIRNWEQLRWWLDENRDRLRRLREVEQDAKKWQLEGKKEGFLSQDLNLEQAEDIYNKYPDELSSNAQEFVTKGIEKRDRLNREEKARRERELQQEKRARKLAEARTRIVTFFLIVVTVLAIVVFSTWQRAEYSRQATEAELLARNSLEQFRGGVDEIESLVSAMKSAQKLRSVVGNKSVQSYPVFSPLTTLQSILFDIHQKNQLIGHTGGVNSVDISQDNKYIVSGGKDGTIRLWNLLGKEILKWKAYQANEVTSVKFSPDSKLIVGVSSDLFSIKIWNTEGQLVKDFKNKETPVNRAYFSSSGKNIIAIGFGDIHIYDLNGKITKESSLGGPFPMEDFSTDGQKIAIISEGKVKILDQSLKTIYEWRAYNRKIDLHSWGISFSTNGSFVATLGNDSDDLHNRTIRLWKLLKNGRVEKVSEFEPLGTFSDIINIQFIPHTDKLALADQAGSIQIYNIAMGKVVEQLNTHRSAIKTMKFSSDGNFVASGAEDGIRLWNLGTNVFMILNGHLAPVDYVEFSKNGDFIVSGVLLADLPRVWNYYGKFLEFFTEPIIAIDLNPKDNYLIATLNIKGFIKLWNLSNNTITLKTEWQANHVKNRDPAIFGAKLSFSPDGTKIAILGGDDNIKFWDLQGKKLDEWKISSKTLKSIDYSPDGNYIAIGYTQGIISIWDTATGQNIIEWQGHSERDRVNRVIFSQDGRYIASASLDGTIKLWSFSEKGVKEIFNFPGHRRTEKRQNIGTTVAFSPDNQKIATADQDGVIKLWTFSGQLIATYNLGINIRDISFSRDGKLLAASNTAGMVVVLSIDGFDELIAHGCAWLDDYLTTHTQIHDELTVCREQSIIALTAMQMAKWGNIEGANSKLKQITNATLRTKLESKVKSLAIPDLFDKAISLARQENTEEAIAKFRQILELQPESKFNPETESNKFTDAFKLYTQVDTFAKQGKIDDAISSFDKARVLDPTVPPNIQRDAMEKLCWFGSLYGYPQKVDTYCGLALYGTSHLSLAKTLNKTLLGDQKGAIENLEALIKSVSKDPAQPDSRYLSRLKRWLEILKTGNNPFTEQELEILIKETKESL